MAVHMAKVKHMYRSMGQQSRDFPHMKMRLQPRGIHLKALPVEDECCSKSAVFSPERE
jgi:hypothetical protein